MSMGYGTMPWRNSTNRKTPHDRHPRSASRPCAKLSALPARPPPRSSALPAIFGRWWPLSTHSLGQKMPGITVGFVPLGQGGALTETWPSGETHIWGSILAFEPPARIVFTWHVGRAPSTAQEIEILFIPAADGGTDVTLVHSGWESFGEDGATMRENYDTGWVFRSRPIHWRGERQPIKRLRYCPANARPIIAESILWKVRWQYYTSHTGAHDVDGGEPS